MAAIKPIEARSVHQIQSGQVIVDLCSVVKELVENSLDAGATSLEIRFKNNGLDSIEVQDNGSGISSLDYETLALKHHTSKLAGYDDLASLQTFGFRGEALSSLCALSTFYVITAQANEVPKGKKLEFDLSGKLNDVTVVAAQKGTTAVVERLFEPLPVRRKELTKNIKKEYGKVLGLLHAYACISAGVKFTVKSSMAKGKSATVFATNANLTTKENIANVYGAKTLSALVPLELQLAFQRNFPQKKDEDGPANQITVRGYISRPVFGEGRQTPDRQMFFVNGRPCGLPQIAKAFNEVYKSFNVLQSPFIFADFEMDTNAYDVNISPDKRTIMLHDSAALVDTLKASLTRLFDQQEHSLTLSQVRTSHLPAYKQLTIGRQSTLDSTDTNQLNDASRITREFSTEAEKGVDKNIQHDPFRNLVSTREQLEAQASEAAVSKSTKESVEALEEATEPHRFHDHDSIAELRELDTVPDGEYVGRAEEINVQDFNLSTAEQQTKFSDQQSIHVPVFEQTDCASTTAPRSPPRASAVQTAFDRVRPARPAAEIATITVGDKTVTSIVGSQPPISDASKTRTAVKDLTTRSDASASTQAFTQRLRNFAAQDIPSAQTGAASGTEAGSIDEAQDLEPELEDFAISNDSSNVSSERADEPGFDDYGANSDQESVDNPDQETDGDHIDESEKKEQEDARVAELIYAAEEKATSLNINNSRRATKVLLGGLHKDSTTSLQLTMAMPLGQIRDMTSGRQLSIKELPRISVAPDKEDTFKDVVNEEDRLSLIVSKNDFSSMHIIGQFNLGFILAVRASSGSNVSKSDTDNGDELFIVDQHASDEKYNFEKLQAETVVGSQRLVQPKQLDLTAVEEEILVENALALEKNGFLIHIDTSGDKPIGQRCKLTGLPLNKEVTFGLEDLEELLHALAESPGFGQSSIVPRPSKVRRMFAMRACRSSIMVGKTLTEGKMRTVISHMGDIDKPWNCPHGRPTIRHLMTLNSFETWQEGDGVLGSRGAAAGMHIWREYAR